MKIPTTRAQSQYIEIEWEAPYDNSDLITMYRVFVRSKDK